MKYITRDKTDGLSKKVTIFQSVKKYHILELMSGENNKMPAYNQNRYREFGRNRPDIIKDTERSLE